MQNSDFIKVIKVLKVFCNFHREGKEIIFLAYPCWGNFRNTLRTLSTLIAGATGKRPPSTPYPASRISARAQADAVSVYLLDSIALVAPRSNRASDYADPIHARCPACTQPVGGAYEW